MITGLLLLGVNAVLVSALLATYGVLAGDNGLVGVAVSVGVVGGVMIVYSVSWEEPRLRSLYSYLSMMVNASTAVLEDLDLLGGRLCVTGGSGSLLAVYTKSECPASANPGIGFTSGHPYFSIPTDAFGDVEALENLSEESLGSALAGLLVEELELCKSVDVENLGGSLVAVHLVGLSDALREYVKYPVDPYTLITATAIARLSGRDVLVVERSTTPSGLRLTVRVGGTA
ncbi:MAG: hypothetical protein RMI56_04485 [Sulfolobales archaeon]|nr:hypothetical protein [Sulfolobales archaeon]